MGSLYRVVEDETDGNAHADGYQTGNFDRISSKLPEIETVSVIFYVTGG
jgi:hypothetical protein